MKKHTYSSKKTVQVNKITPKSPRNNGISLKTTVPAFVLMLAGILFLTSTDTGQFLAQKAIDAIGYAQNMANPYYRYVHIPEGLRKEQIAEVYSDVLAWNDTQKQAFLDTYSTTGSGTTTAPNVDGYYFPGTYMLPVDATGDDVSQIMLDKFNSTVTSTIDTKIKNNLKSKINLDTAVKIASIIQRESNGKSDMRLISGIIWNRIFKGMPLGMDATLQYAKGDDQNGWWPQVLSADKNINSPYNTYKNVGLPPAPISNPGMAAIEAAYNPLATNCLYYLHDNNHQIHCSATYEQHMQLINTYLK